MTEYFLISAKKAKEAGRCSGCDLDRCMVPKEKDGMISLGVCGNRRCKYFKRRL